MPRHLIVILIAFVAGLLVMRQAPRWLQPAAARDRGMATSPCPLPTKLPVWADFPEPDLFGLCGYAADNARLIAAGTPVDTVFLGDSIFDFWDDRDPGFLGGGSQGGERVNRGINGHSSAALLVRFRQDVIALKPRRVHILVGLNDVAGNSGISTPETVLANIETMVELAQLHRIVPVLATLPPASRFEQDGMVDPGPWVAELNRRIKALAAQRGLALADYHAVLADPAGMPKAGLYVDFSHPNAAGYQLMRPVAEAALAAADRKKAP